MKEVDLVVIGGGSGGVRAARIAAEHGASVVIAEEYRFGGTCVIRGCVPKKLFVYASEYGHRIPDAAGFGWKLEGHFDWSTLRDNKDKYIDYLSNLYNKSLQRAGVEIILGRAELVGPNRVRIGDQEIAARNILVATGGRPLRPDVPGAELGITSNEVFHFESLPERITVVGGGYIGLEFSSIFLGLGCKVSLVHHRHEVLRGFDEDIRHHVTENIRKAGAEMLFETEVAHLERKENGALHFECRDGTHHETDAVMFATGRCPNTSGIGLEAAGVRLGERGGVLVDDYGKSSIDNIYAVGDCTDRLQLTPVAIREGHAVADTLFGGKPRPIVTECVATAIFTQPPAATVGLTESEARERHEVDIYKSDFRPLFHSLSGRNERSFMKLVVDRQSDRVLGVHMVGEYAAEIIQAAAIAVTMGATKADFDRTVALHPTTAEELVLMSKPS
jgi:glutathione reductase (NADPH)